MFKGKLNSDILIPPLQSISSIIEEGVFKFDNDGLSFENMDGSGTAFVRLYIPKNSFKEYEIEESISVGVNLKKMLNYLKRLEGIIEIVTDGKVVNLKGFDPIEKNFTLPVLNDLSNKEMLSISDLEFKGKIKLEYDVFKEVINDCLTVSPTIMFRLTPTHLELASKNNIGGSCETQIQAGDKTEINCSNNLTSSFNGEYIQKMLAGKIAKFVEIEMGNEYPIKIFQSGEVNLIWILAPFVNEGDSSEY